MIKNQDKSYSVSDVMKRLGVTRQTVYKWLDTVIPSNKWFSLPISGHIRIKESAIKKIEKGVI